MKNIFLAGLFLSLAMFGLTACGDSGANANGNANHATNTTGSTMGNAINTVSNTVANVTKSDSPEDFAKDAAQGGMAEVEVGNLAQKNSQNADVKKFGQMLVEDHSKANAELKAIAAKENITLPTDMGSHKSVVDRLQPLNGPAFDKSFVDAMLTDHNKDIKDFEKQAESSTNPQIKAFAAKTLPTLKKHLKAVEDIRDKMMKQ